jgi:hypothetical protein
MKYRFYKTFNNQKWWATEYDQWTNQPFFTVRRSEAALFTELDWIQWAEAEGLEREEVAEDQVMRLINAPTLPGFEL